MGSKQVVRVLLVTREVGAATRIRDAAMAGGDGSFVEWVVEPIDRLGEVTHRHDYARADVILLDFVRPVVRPDELPTWVAQHGSGTPIIALVSPGDELTREAVLRHGVVECLTEEQFTPERLGHAVQNADQHRRLQIAVERATLVESQRQQEALRGDRIIEAAREVCHTLNNELSRTLGYLELIALVHQDDNTQQMVQEAITGITMAAEQIGGLQKTIHQVARERAEATPDPLSSAS